MRCGRSTIGLWSCGTRATALVLACCLATCNLASGDDSALASSSDVLRVISYNVQFLPGVASLVNQRKDPLYRAETIGKAMSQFDIVGLNEVFEEKTRDLILAPMKEAWGEEFHSVAIPPAEPNRFNGGLVIASRRPILEWNHTIFSQFSTPREYGFSADGFARKGVLHARIARNLENKDDFVDVFVTHLESKSDEAREVQYAELAQFVREKSAPTRPTIIMGDMNTRGNPVYREDANSKYSRMMNQYVRSRPEGDLIDLWPALHGDALGGTNEQESSDVGNRIDYVFVSNPKSGGNKLVPLDVRVNPYLDERVVALSDHSAVEADLRWLKPE